MDRAALIQLARKIEREVDPAELGRLVAQFDHFVPHPAASDLFFFPWLEFGDADYPGPEAIVDAALSYVDPFSGSGEDPCHVRHRVGSSRSLPDRGRAPRGCRRS
jgi:hypothetical protein